MVSGLRHFLWDFEQVTSLTFIQNENKITLMNGELLDYSKILKLALSLQQCGAPKSHMAL